MQFALFIFAMGVLNFSIGFGLAVCFGHGPPVLRDAWRMLWTASPREPSQEEKPAPAAVPEASLPEEPEEVEDPVEEPELSDFDALQRLVEKTTSSLANLAARLNKTDAFQHGRTAWSYVGELQEVCDPYLQRLSEAAERLLDNADEAAEGMALGDEVEQVILEQVAQLETTLSNLQYMDFDASMSTETERLQSETKNTLAMARNLQNALEAAATTAGEQDAEPAFQPEKPASSRQVEPMAQA